MARNITGPDRLVAFSSCDDVLAKLKAAGLGAVGPYGFGAGSMPYRAAAPNAAPAPDGSATGSLSGPAYSGTNNQEAGVDEPDLIKTDGHRIVTVTDGVLRVVDASTRKQSGTVRIADHGNAQLLLSGDHALVITTPSVIPNRDPLRPSTSSPIPPTTTRLTLVDLSGGPRTEATYDFDGAYVDARQVGSTARVVVQSAPRASFPYHQNQTDAQRAADSHKIVSDMTLDDWLPHFTSIANGVTTEGRVDCAAVTHPAEYSGTNMVSVLSFDLGAAQLGNGNPVTVVADGSTVYASATSLYVASDQRWRLNRGGPIPMQPNGAGALDDAIGSSFADGVNVPLAKPKPEPPAPTPAPAEVQAPATHIYRFDIARPGPPLFVGGGSVPGYLLNQYAMSEWNGSLRVATTSFRTSSVFTLAIDGGALKRIGHVGGLGRNQQIYAVRFIGATAYVVTFRQVDPLYVIDLSDPAHPVTKGELELAGYSAYLHPLDASHLIGIGQDADANGRLQGTQVSIFDVSDPSAPKLTARTTIPNSGSQAEYDAHAFLYWAPAALLVVPVQQYEQQAASAIAFHVGTSLTRIGSVPSSAGVDRNVVRSLVIGPDLWTLSASGLVASDMTTLHLRAQITW